MDRAPECPHTGDRRVGIVERTSVDSLLKSSNRFVIATDQATLCQIPSIACSDKVAALLIAHKMTFGQTALFRPLHLQHPLLEHLRFAETTPGEPLVLLPRHAIPFSKLRDGLVEPTGVDFLQQRRT